MNKQRLIGKKAVIYSRVSTEEQKKLGYSLQYQESALKKFCENNDMILVNSYAESKSASNMNRPEFNKMIEFIVDNPNAVQYLLVLRWDRFTRDSEDGILMNAKLKKLKVRVNAIEQWAEGQAGVMYKLLNIGMAEMENQIKSQRTLEGNHKAIERGLYPYRAPKGYKKIKDSNGKSIMVKNPDEWNKVKNVFRDFISGLYSQREIIEKHSKFGLVVSKSNLSRMLQNIAYAGKIVQREILDPDDREFGALRNETIVEGIHEPMITMAEFKVIQGLLKKK